MKKSIGITACLVLLAGSLQAQVTSRVSVDRHGQGQNGASGNPMTSQDGRYVAFFTTSINLVPGDENGPTQDVVVKDRLTGSIERVSLSSAGEQANDRSTYFSISACGRYIAFQSEATNLVAEDANGFEDIFWHDRETGETRMVSLGLAGGKANGNSRWPAISGDGQLVAFYSFATNLVEGDTNGLPDIFAHDLRTGTIERISVADDGSQSNGYVGSSWTGLNQYVSGDGRYVAFQSNGDDIVPGDIPNTFDIFVRDRLEGRTRLASVAMDGGYANNGSYYPSLSSDGRYVAFESNASNLVPGDTATKDIFVRDLKDGVTRVVSRAPDGSLADGYSNQPNLARNGKAVAFRSDAGNLVAAQDLNSREDIFLADLESGNIRLCSMDTQGNQPSASHHWPVASGNGRAALWGTTAYNLIYPWDSNGATDVYRHGAELTLESSADRAQAGDLLDLILWGGQVAGASLIAITAVNGIPYWLPIAEGSFNVQGIFGSTFSVPHDPALVGLEFTFGGAGITEVLGIAEVSNPVSILFE